VAKAIVSTTSGFYTFAILEMVGESMNKAAHIFKGENKIWKR
jgi:hypothetical protein